MYTKSPELTHLAKLKYCTVTETKTSLERFKGRFEQAEERTIKLEDKTMEILDSEEQKDEWLKESQYYSYQKNPTALGLCPSRGTCASYVDSNFSSRVLVSIVTVMSVFLNKNES